MDFSNSPGTLCDELGIGDVAIASTVVQHDVDTSALGDPAGHLSCLNTTHLAAVTDLAAQIADEAVRQGLKHCVGTIASGDQFLNDERHKKWIHEIFDAIAGDMEAEAIEQVCRMNRVSFVFLANLDIDLASILSIFPFRQSLMPLL